MMIANDYTESSGSGLLKFFTCLIVLISFLWVIRSFKKIRIWGIHRICLLWMLIMPIIMFLNHAHISEYFSTILWPLFFEVGYIFTSLERKQLKHIRFLFIFVFLVGLYFFIQSLLFGKVDQTNTIYFPLLTAPFLLCCRNQRHQLVILIGISLLCVWSFKRGVLLIVLLLWIFYFLQIVRRKRNIILILGIASAIILGGVFALKRINQASGGILETRVEKAQEDDGGGRLNIYPVVLTMIDTSSTIQKFIGHGHMGVRRDSPLELSAHNDFLEVLYDYGLIIFILYLALWYYVIKRLVYHIRINSIYSLPYFCSFAIFLLLSMVSHLILYASYFNYLVMFWGCMEGLKDKDLLSIKKH